MTDTKTQEGQPGGARRIEIHKKVEKLCNDISDMILSQIPPDVVEHLCNSKKEFLMAIQSAIDKEIERSEKKKARAHELHKEK